MKLSIHLALAGLALLASCSGPDTKPPAETAFDFSQPDLIQRGKYLTTIGACHDCHSPKVMTPNGPEVDTTRLLSGHPQQDLLPALPGSEEWISFSADFTAAVGPWGVSYAANLTPDDTGTGNWTFEQFKTAIRKGKYKGLEGSRDLLPPMPWQVYKSMTDEDLAAVFAYLRSLPPVSNLVPAPISPEKLIASKSEKQPNI